MKLKAKSALSKWKDQYNLNNIVGQKEDDQER